MLNGLVQGKTYQEIGVDLKLTGERIRQKEKAATNKILPFLNIVELRQENQRVREENQRLYEEIERLQNAQADAAHQADSPSEQPQPSTPSRNLQGTSFDRMINDLGLSYSCLNPLVEHGISKIGDLVKIDKMTLIRRCKFGAESCKEIEEKLKALGLHLGMNLDHMSDQAFEAHDKRMSEKLSQKSRRRILEEDKAFFTTTTTHILKAVINMAPKLGIPLTPLCMSSLMHVLRRNTYKDIAKELGSSECLARNYALEGIEQLKMIPEYLNRQLEKIASATQKEKQPSDSELSEKMRLIMNTELKDVPYCYKNSAVAVLEHYGILTVGDLCSRHRSEIEEIRALRSKMNNIDKLLTDLGLTYGMKI